MPKNMRKANKSLGFTLIEVVITVAIVGIISAIVYPSYTSFIVRSDRAEAQRELVRLANLQEQLYTDRRAYTDNMEDLGFDSDPYVTETANYSIDAVTANNGATFILTATAQKRQIRDVDCPSLTLNEVGQKGPDNDICWEN